MVAGMEEQTGPDGFEPEEGLIYVRYVKYVSGNF